VEWSTIGQERDLPLGHWREAEAARRKQRGIGLLDDAAIDLLDIAKMSVIRAHTAQ
jgi:hypothetical protein